MHFLFLFLFILFFDVENILNRILCFLKVQNHYVNAYSTTADKPMQRKVWHPCGDKKILSMHVSSFVDIFFFSHFQTYYNRAQESQFPSNFFQSVTIEFYKWRCAVYCYKKKITLLDEEYGCIVYSMLENNNQSVFLIYPPVRLSMISWRIVPHFFNQISWRFLFLFSQSSSLLLHSYVCEPPRPITHPHTSCPEKKRVEGRVHPDDII